MSLEDMLKNVSGITNKVINSNCWDGQFNVLEGIQVLQSKVNEIIVAINNGIIKGDKGDTPNVQVGETTTLEPNSSASVTQTGDMLNPIFNFAIPKGEKGEKGDTGKTSESINDNLIDSDHTFSSEKITNMFNSLQDVKGIKYGADKDYLVMNGTKNGVIKDLKIKGRSLVNILGKQGTNEFTLQYSPNNDNKNMKYFDGVNLELNKRYYLIFDAKESTGTANYKIWYRDINNTLVYPKMDPYLNLIDGRLVTSFVANFAQSATSKTVTLYIDNNVGASSKVSKVVLMQSESIENVPNGYFEGIASVGNGNEIEVLSRKEDGNLFDGELEIGNISTSNGNNEIGNTWLRSNFIQILGKPFSITIENPLILNNMISYYYDKNLNYISYVGLYNSVGGNFTPPINAEYIRLRFPNEENSKKNIMVSFSKYPQTFVKNKQDKKPFLFKDTHGNWKPILNIRGIDENNCDIVDSVNNKFYENITEIIFNGDSSENWSLQKTENGKAQFTMSAKRSGIKPNSKILSDKYNNITSSQFANMEVGIFNGSAWGIVVSDPGITDVQSLKTKLQSNNVKINVQLIESKQYEVNPLYLQSFENETMISFKYGVVNGVSEFYADSNLGSIVLNNMERISNIENEVFQVKKIVLNGDYRTLAESTYPNDFKEVNKHE